MTIKQLGGVFGRNPTFNDVTIEGDLIINGEVFTGLDFQGSWNASTNSPALASSVGTNGEFYIVSVAGTTDLNGITNWGIGDWAIFNGTAWQRVEGGADGNFDDLTANSLVVNGNATVDGLIVDYNTALYETDSTISNYAVNNGVYINGNSAGFLSLAGDGSQRTNIRVHGDTNSTPDIIDISTAGTFATRIDANGTINIGCIDGSSLYNNTGTNTGAGILANGQIQQAVYQDSPHVLNRTGSDGDITVFRREGASVVGGISVTASATAYNTSSDYRLKEDDAPMTGATERVKALRPINFAWKVGGPRVDGFFAHEAQEVVPECVRGIKDAMRTEGEVEVPDYQGIDQSKLVPLLTAALQEAITKIEALTTRIETLEGQ